MEPLLEALREADIGKVVQNEPLSKHTTIKVGGPAAVYVEPSDVNGLKRALAITASHGARWLVIGRGSNLLVKDGGYRGVVINLAKGLNDLTYAENGVIVGGGYPLIKLVTVVSKKGLSGLEFAGGIPGSVGGAVYMNAGAHGSDMSKVVKRVHVLFADGTMRWLSNEEMQFSYRTSILQQKKGIVIEAEIILKEADRDSVISLMRKHKDYRRDTQPWDAPCCGSVFRNPLPQHSGALIEKAGLKGKRIGGAQISELHGNFIVNVGRKNTTAKDVLTLIDHVKTTIKEKYNISLETEVEIIGNP